MVSDRYQESADGQHEREAEQAEDGDAHLQQAVIDLAGVARQQHDADGVALALHRLGDGDQQPVVLGAADIGRHFAALVGAVHPQLLPDVGLPVDARPRMHLHHLHRLPLRQPGHHLVVDRAHPAEQRPARCRGGQRLHRHRAALALAHATVGDHLAVGRVELGVGVRRRLGEAAQQRAREIGDEARIVAVGIAHRALAKRAGIDLRLLAQG